jgi:hypothetical protein
MPILKPCNHCRHRGNCEDHTSKLKSLKGTGITAAQFKCYKHTSEFSPGLMVEAEIENATVGYEDGGRIPRQDRATLTGVVMRWVGPKVLVYIDDEQEAGKTERPVVKLWPDRLVPANLYVAVCEECGLPKGVKLGKWECSTCHPENVGKD